MTMTPSEVARLLGCPPTAITQLFYQRKLPDSLAPIAGRSRRIPEEAVPQIRAALAKSGKIPAEPSAAV